MIVRRPHRADWEKFIVFAEDEGWRVPNSELSLFQGPWSEYAHVLDVDGFCGLVTAVAYEKSAWVGNLLVPSWSRERGYGTHLFKSVLADLSGKGIPSVWLTASEQGRSIYEREGFTVVDNVERWVLPSQPEICGQSKEIEHCAEGLSSADALFWGESRRLLLSEICRGGRVFSVGSAVALLQRGAAYQILGPWYLQESSMADNHELLQRVIASKDPSVEMVVDCIASSKAQLLLRTNGFQYCGKSSLMAYGDYRDVHLKGMAALASLGSVG